MPKMSISCNSCGKSLELAPKQPPCMTLTGWLTVAQWKGAESVDQLNFCSFGCLQKWLENQLPRIPDVFLNALQEEDNKTTDT